MNPPQAYAFVLITTAALCASACREPTRARAADGVATQVATWGRFLDDVTYDDRDRTWFLIRPKDARDAAPSTVVDATLVCRLDERVLTCGAIPDTEVARERESVVRLVPPAKGATPLLVVKRVNELVFVEPFTWRHVRRLEDVRMRAGAEDLLVGADGAVLAISVNGPMLARPGDAFRPVPGFPEGPYFEFSLSRWGLLWTEEEPGSGAWTLKSANLDGLAFAPIRSYGQHPNWFRACRHGDTFGFIALRSDAHPFPRLGMLNLATGDAVESSAMDAYDVQCRAGEVGGIAARLREDRSARCDGHGCRTFFTPVDRPNLNYHQLVLVEGTMMLVSNAMNVSKIVTRRLGEEPRARRFADLDLTMTRLVMTPHGALAYHSGGQVVAFDHQGRVLPLELVWADGTAPPAAP